MFDLTLLGPAVSSLQDDWNTLGLVFEEPSEPSPYAKPSSFVSFESSHLGTLVVWTSGEAELMVVRISDGYRLVKTYSLLTGEDLDQSVEDLLKFLRTGAVPAGGYLGEE